MSSRRVSVTGSVQGNCAAERATRAAFCCVCNVGQWHGRVDLGVPGSVHTTARRTQPAPHAQTVSTTYACHSSSPAASRRVGGLTSANGAFRTVSLKFFVVKTRTSFSSTSSTGSSSAKASNSASGSSSTASAALASLDTHGAATRKTTSNRVHRRSAARCILGVLLIHNRQFTVLGLHTAVERSDWL